MTFTDKYYFLRPEKSITSKIINFQRESELFSGRRKYYKKSELGAIHDISSTSSPPCDSLFSKSSEFKDYELF